MTTNVKVEYTILFGPHKGKRTAIWLPAEEPEVRRILNDPRMNGKIVDRV